MSDRISSKMWCYVVILLLMISILGLAACTEGYVKNEGSVTEPPFNGENMDTENWLDPEGDTVPMPGNGLQDDPYISAPPETSPATGPGTESGNDTAESSASNSDNEKASDPVSDSQSAPDIRPSPEPSSEPRPTPIPKPEPSPDSEVVSDKEAGIVNPYVPYTYDQMMLESQKLAERYPEVIALDTIGSSVEGRDLLLIKLGTGSKKIILCGAHHAREYITSSYLMKMAEEYAKAYTDNRKLGNYDVRKLLDQITLYVVPMVNPDGVNLVNNGLNAVADKEAVQAMALVRPTYREWKANINGVDLNRQYPAYWEEKYDDVGKPASENYKGKGPATEPEVKAMMKLSEENEFILAASFHAKGNSIFWADEGTVDKIPGVEAMAKRLAALTKYEMLPVSKNPSVYGAGYENWFRMKFSRPAFCIELTPYNNTDVPHDDRKFDSLVWNNAKYIGLFLAEEALKRQ